MVIIIKNIINHLLHLCLHYNIGGNHANGIVLIGINNFEATIRKSTFGFIQRLAKSTNSLIVTIEKSWSVRIDIWNFWEKTLYIATAT